MRHSLLLIALFTAFSCNSNQDKTIYRDYNSLKTSVKNSQVTTGYGALVVKEGEFTGDTKIIPWSSWWFPTKDKYMFESNVLFSLVQAMIRISRTE